MASGDAQLCIWVQIDDGQERNAVEIETTSTTSVSRLVQTVLGKDLTIVALSEVQAQSSDGTSIEVDMTVKDLLQSDCGTTRKSPLLLTLPEEEPPPPNRFRASFQPLFKFVGDEYIQRKCASVAEVVSKLIEGKNIAFIGPKYCGKTTTLQAVYNELVNRRDCTVMWIDMKNLDEMDLGHLVTVGNDHIIVLIDNSQDLTKTQFNMVRSVRHFISTRVACLAFSPNLSSPRNALMNCGVSAARLIEYQFTPFDEEELLQYLQKIGMPDLLGQIDCSVPGVLSKASLCGSMEGFNDRVKVASYNVIEDHLNDLRQAGESSSSTHSTEADSMTMALTKMICYGSDRLSSVELNQLVVSGWGCIDGEVLKLPFPRDYYLLYLNQKLDILRSCMAIFSKGMALEFQFYYEILKHGLAAKTSDSKHQLNLPRAKTWMQLHVGDLPIADMYQREPLLIKLAENYVCIDFLLIDPKLGVRNKSLYFIQVSVQQYQNCPTGRRYEAIEDAGSTLRDMSPRDYYSTEFRIGKKNCFYVYASSASSHTITRNASKVYICEL